jgi:uncharacterized membrane protein YfcA
LPGTWLDEEATAIAVEVGLTELLVVLAALAVGAFVKGMTGGGLPLLAIPVMALFIGIERAVIIMSIPGVVSNVWLVAAHARASSETRDLPALVGTGVVGTVVGTVLLTTVDARWLSVGLACLIVAYVTLRLRRPQTVLTPSASAWASPPVGLAAGALQGSTGVSGPLLSTYLHSFGLAPRAYIFSVSTLFLIFSLAQVLTLAALGAYTPTLVAEGVLAILPVAVMLPLGSRLSLRMRAQTFSNIVLATLVVAAVALLLQALA